MDNYKLCKFRQINEKGQIICKLSQKILGTENDSFFIVNDSICSACYETKEIPDENKINNVVAYVLANAAKQIIDNGGLADCSVKRAYSLIDHIKKEHKPCKCGSQNKLVRILGKVT